MSDKLLNLFKSSPIENKDILRNLPLFISRIDLADMMFMIELYKKSMNTHGVIAEFGSRWGRNLALFCALRSIFEPYNHIRKIIGFDTYSGFSEVTKEDGEYSGVQVGGFSVSDNYENYLDEVLQVHEDMAPIKSKKKFKLVKGDIIETLPEYLIDHPETIFSLVYIDVDLYGPTKKILELIKPHLVKGSIIGFDELCHPNWPGETKALSEEIGLNNVALRRMSFSPTTSYLVVE